MSRNNLKLQNIPGAVRPLIEQLSPCVSGGAYSAKRIQGDQVTVSATVILDGHDLLACELLVRHEDDKKSLRLPMLRPNPGKDIWEAAFPASKLGKYFFTVEARVDRFETWRGELIKKFDAGQDVSVELLSGAQLLKTSAKLAKGAERKALAALEKALKNTKSSQAKRIQLASSPRLQSLMKSNADRSLTTRYERELSVDVDRERAAFSAWYEFFPRSTSLSPGQHGTFKTSERMIPYIADMGFDVIYLPPIHPIGTIHRKGRNNSLTPSSTDPGSPWGIGSAKGGHKSVHPELGTLADFKKFIARARKHEIEIAMDIAFQCAPDHPYVRSHPEWFKKRADGSIQYAENPPKKYQDIYPFNFESSDWQALWNELKSVVLFWARQGVKIFRVDNPHTKPVRFWAWLISEVRREHPDVLFLAEAFTRPAMMYHLGKIGFSQSYTYFTWRNTPGEFKKYLEELTGTEVADYYRPNFWPNTPDILPRHLQTGESPAKLPAFATRVALAATLSSNYGLYGPAYEQCVNAPFHAEGEEYLDSEKYEVKNWDLKAPGNLSGFIAKLNQIRKENPALHRTGGVRFIESPDPRIVCFIKQTPDRSNTIFVAANLDFESTRSGKVQLPMESLGFTVERPATAEDLSSGKKLKLEKGAFDIKLDPASVPVSIFRLTQQPASRSGRE
ncbi:MAG: hypothetical protein A2X94_08890 [Bdellovibrionales bacterium GWB1_55_8]|nr:MAG: hypothetical protein A2X94_08890 [Bdellovibrionales bacterium GWB1_55_8]